MREGQEGQRRDNGPRGVAFLQLQSELDLPLRSLWLQPWHVHGSGLQVGACEFGAHRTWKFSARKQHRQMHAAGRTSAWARGLDWWCYKENNTKTRGMDNAAASFLPCWDGIGTERISGGFAGRRRGHRDFLKPKSSHHFCSIFGSPLSELCRAAWLAELVLGQRGGPSWGQASSCLCCRHDRSPVSTPVLSPVRPGWVGVLGGVQGSASGAQPSEGGEDGGPARGTCGA